MSRSPRKDIEAAEKPSERKGAHFSSAGALWASDLIELSARQNFALFLAFGAVYRGWARSASNDTTEGIARIEDGIRAYRSSGSTLLLPLFLTLKAEALHLANRTSEALEAIKEAEVLVERFENRYWCAELHRLRGVFLAAMGTDEPQIETSFCAAISTAREQKSISLEKRAEGTYAEYRRQKASVRRMWLPITSLVAACNAVPSAERFGSGTCLRSAIRRRPGLGFS